MNWVSSCGPVGEQSNVDLEDDVSTENNVDISAEEDSNVSVHDHAFNSYPTDFIDYHKSGLYFSCFMPSTCKRFFIHITSLQGTVAAMYFAYVVDNETHIRKIAMTLLLMHKSSSN
jgi:hypothetical protein